jgi:hypothetical protein
MKSVIYLDSWFLVLVEWIRYFEPDCIIFKFIFGKYNQKEGLYERETSL